MNQLNLFPLGHGSKVELLTQIENNHTIYQCFHYRDVNGNKGYKFNVIQKESKNGRS